MAFRVSVPETPCRVSVWLPVAALPATVTVTVADWGLMPSRVTDEVETEQLIFAVPPLHDRAASPVKPSIDETVTVVEPECDLATVIDDGETATAKSEIACVRVFEVLPRKLPLLDVKVATTVCVPTASELVEKAAVPADRVLDADAVELPSTKNLTVPASVPAEAEDTDAVKVTDFPTTDGLTLVERDVVVGAAVTLSLSTDEVLARKFPSPRYFAVSECAPSVRTPGPTTS